jgi:hypothetical protein
MMSRWVVDVIGSMSSGRCHRVGAAPRLDIEPSCATVEMLASWKNESMEWRAEDSNRT